MADYLLTCACGKQTAVSTSQAGQAVRCECGTSLEVPTLRELRGLPQAKPTGHVKPIRRWENQQRTAFVLIVVALASLATAGYLAWILPPSLILPTAAEFDAAIGSAIENGTPAQVYTAYQELLKGIDVAPLQLSQSDRSAEYRRKLMVWGIELTLGLAAVGFVAALVVVRKRPSVKK